MITGIVVNVGNITLTNVCVTNFVTGIGNYLVLGPTTLTNGEKRNFSSNYLVPTNWTECFVSDTVRVKGMPVCPNAQPASASASTNCPVLFTPRLLITQLSCVTNPVPGGLMVITGTVCNIGNIVLTNVVLSNEVSGVASSIVTGPNTLGIGECGPISVSFIVPSNYMDCTIRDMVTVRGTMICLPATTTATNAVINCPVKYTPVISITA